MRNPLYDEILNELRVAEGHSMTGAQLLRRIFRSIDSLVELKEALLVLREAGIVSIVRSEGVETIHLLDDNV